METKTVNIKEYNNYKDKCSINGSSDLELKGRVKVFEHRVGDSKLYLLRDTSNLVLYRGRNWLAQRAINSDLVGCTGYSSLFLSWFAVGTGASYVNSPLQVTSPNLTNVQLSTHGVIDSGTRFVTIGGKQYHKFDADYPLITTDNEIPTTDLSSTNDAKLIIQIITTLTGDEANGDGGVHDPDAYQDINEAGLYVSDKNTVSPIPTTMQMFARVTFPTIRKNDTVELIFNWYLYF